MAGDQYDRPDCCWAMVVTGVRASRANTCGVTGLAGRSRGRLLTCARRVANDREMESSESRTAEEPCGRVLVRKRVGRDNIGRLFW